MRFQLLFAMMGLDALTLASPAPAPAPAAITALAANNAAKGNRGRPKVKITFAAAPTTTAGDPVDTKATSCYNAMDTLDNSFPTAAPALHDWLASSLDAAVATLTGTSDNAANFASAVCPTGTPPANISSAYTEYLRASSSWATAHASEASSIAAACGGVTSVYAEMWVTTDAAACTTAVDKAYAYFISRANSAATTATGAPAPATTASKAGAPRDTGFVQAAAAIAVAAVGFAAVL